MKTFDQALSNGHHVRHFQILAEPAGWRVVERADSAVVRDTRYTDWHRVERARRAFRIETSSLRAEGWRDAR